VGGVHISFDFERRTKKRKNGIQKGSNKNTVPKSENRGMKNYSSCTWGFEYLLMRGGFN